MKIQETTRKAYESVNRGNDSLYSRVLTQLSDNRSSTCDELEVELEARHQSVSSRIRKGVQDGFIKNSGEKRRTRTGRQAIVWQLTSVTHLACPHYPNCDTEGCGEL